MLCHFNIIAPQHTCTSVNLSPWSPAASWRKYQKNLFHRNDAKILKSFLREWRSIVFKPRTLFLVEIRLQGCAAVHFQEQSISFTVYSQRAGIYIKNRQTSREKIDGVLFPAGRVRGCAQDGESMDYSMSSVFYSLENTFGAEVII